MTRSPVIANPAPSVRPGNGSDRILLVDPCEKGGLPIYTALIAESLAAIGLRPIILAHRRLEPTSRPSAWPTRRWLPNLRWPRPPGARALSKPEQGAIWLACAATIAAAAIILRPRIVHLQYPIHPRFDFALIRLLRLFVPVVLTAHDVIPHDPGSNAEARARRTYNAATLVLAHSAPAATEIDRIARVPAIVIAHPAAKLASIPDRATARQKLGLAPDVRTAAAVGFIRAYKGYTFLADLWDRLGRDAPNLPVPHLLVIGALIDQSEQDAMTRLGKHPGVTLRLGYASDEDIIAACAAADIVLLPYERGSDSGVLHLARSVGTPVLASEAPQLAAAVIASLAGTTLPSDPDLWAQALRGALPPPPPTPPSIAETGRAHQAAYDRAVEIWQRRRRHQKSPAPAQQADLPR